MGMKKQAKTEQPKLWMNSFGLFLSMKPTIVKGTWLSSIGAIGARSKDYTHFEFNIYGKVRILSSTKIDDSPFREIASERVSGTDLYETVLMDIEFSRYDLESDSSPDLQMLGEITPNYSE